MKGTYFLGDQKFETRQLQERALAPDEVLVRVAACGVCGTDVHIYHGDKGSAAVHPPVILGHEFSGIVEAVGSQVDRIAVGDHVTVDPNIYCGTCHYCQIGKKQLCSNLYALGVNRIGLSVGADFAVDPMNESLPDRLRELLGTDGADVVVECVGNTIATAQAFQAAKRGTSILLFSVPKSGATHPLSLEDVYQKELTIVGSMINPDTHERAVQLINSGRIQLKPLITHCFPTERVKDAILMQMSNESIKVVVGNELEG